MIQVVLWVISCVSVALGMIYTYQLGKRDAIDQVLEAFHSLSGSGHSMSVPEDLFERIDEIGGYDRPKAEIK